MLDDLLSVFGDRKAVLARELTKIHEEFRRGLLSDVALTLDEQTTRGEYVVIVEGKSAEPIIQKGSIVDQVEFLIADSGLTKKDAIKQVARLRGLSKNEVYQQVILAESED